MWGIIAIIIAQYSLQLGTLIEVVNMLGSWFYGTILGVFLLAFFDKRLSSNAVFFAAIICEGLIISTDLKFFGFAPSLNIAYLWLNMIGCLGVIVLSYILEGVFLIKRTLSRK
mgnify:CR=1 FL=1